MMASASGSIFGLFFLLQTAFLFLVCRVHCYTPGLGRKEVAGIWRLSSKPSFLPRLSILSTEDQNVEDEEQILLSLKEDGSFVQHDAMNERGTETRMTTTLTGVWDYNDGELVLAIDRPPHNKVLQANDTIIIGTIETQSRSSLLNKRERMKNESDVYLSVPTGQLSIGKFTYPKHHPSFFEQPIFQPQYRGTVKLQQVLGVLNTQRSRSSKNKEKQAAAFHKTDFYGKKFLLTSTPVQPARKSSGLTWNRKEGKYISEKLDEGSLPPVDIRVMSIEFFANNTFAAYGSNKILRGRFGITSDKRDHLWFQVSLFGAGRTAPGSVYSEGNGLTHDDRRSYMGTISHKEKAGGGPRNSKKVLFVEGSAVVGSDLGSDARPEPVAHFTMREVESLSQRDDVRDDNPDSFESVFE